MGNGLIIFGLFGIASVIAGQHENVYTGVKSVLSDSRTFPLIVLVAGLLIIGNLSGSKGWQALTKALAVLIGIAVLFSVVKSPITWRPSKGEKNG